MAAASSCSPFERSIAASRRPPWKIGCARLPANDHSLKLVLNSSLKSLLLVP